MSIIKSDRLTVEVDEIGSSLSSIIDNQSGSQYIWQGDEKSWTGHDVTIFPFVGRLKDGFYTVDGKKYFMPPHGLCREHNFAIEDKSQSHIAHVFRYDEDTLKVYPYKFKLTVQHSVNGCEYVKTMTVTNIDDKEIYYSLGGHPAMSVIEHDGDTKQNAIVFPREIAPNNYYLDEVGHYITKKAKYASFKELSCAKELMKQLKTVILTDEKFVALELRRSDGVKFQFAFDEPPALAFWSHPDSGAYYCVEPWWGVPDFAEPTRELKDKELIQKLAVGESRQYSFSIKFIRED